MDETGQINVAWSDFLTEEGKAALARLLKTPGADFAELARAAGLDPVHDFPELDPKRAWTEIARLEGHYGSVYSVAFSPDGARLATGSGYDTAQIWDLASGAEIARLEGHEGWVTS